MSVAIGASSQFICSSASQSSALQARGGRGALEQRVDGLAEPHKLAQQRDRRRLALRWVEVLEDGELRVAHSSSRSELISQPARLANRNHHVVAVVQQHN